MKTTDHNFFRVARDPGYNLPKITDTVDRHGDGIKKLCLWVWNNFEITLPIEIKPLVHVPQTCKLTRQVR